MTEILHQGRFEVPWHQREYDWEAGDVERFWNDILSAQKRGATDYFVGSIVLTRQAEAVYHIQDGQQRLVTYSLMCAALRGVFEKQAAGNTDIRVQESQKIIFDVSPTGMISQRQIDDAEPRINPSPKTKTTSSTSPVVGNSNPMASLGGHGISSIATRANSAKMRPTNCSTI